MSDFLHLIQDLGDQSWIKRKEASKKLREMASSDPEVVDELVLADADGAGGQFVFSEVEPGVPLRFA